MFLNLANLQYVLNIKLTYVLILYINTSLNVKDTLRLLLFDLRSIFLVCSDPWMTNTGARCRITGKDDRWWGSKYSSIEVVETCATYDQPMPVSMQNLEKNSNGYERWVGGRTKI